MSNFSNFYNIYISLCANKKVSPSRVAEEIGLTRTTANGWKKGKKPSDVSLRKIADYFGVTVDYLLGNEEQEKTPAPMTEREKLVAGIMEFVQNMDDEKLKSFYEFIVK